MTTPLDRNPGRLIVVDACLPKRLATELCYRNRVAISASELGWRHDKDPQLLPALHAKYDTVPWVLVTSDDSMPETHAELVASLGLTIATTEPAPFNLPDEQVDGWGREIVHRWAHWVARQPDGRVERLTPLSHRPWTRRRK